MMPTARKVNVAASAIASAKPSGAPANFTP